jgi:hypothetical protein
MVLDAIAAAMAVAGNANSLRASSLSSEAAKFGSHPPFLLMFSSSFIFLVFPEHKFVTYTLPTPAGAGHH